MVLVSSDRVLSVRPSKPDPRLRELVRLLARQTAREFVDAEWKREDDERLRK
ncbi:hypothetical protein [Pseudochelatococcus sp. B33]